jgi:carboxymethylenebutenolidase
MNDALRGEVIFPGRKEMGEIHDHLKSLLPPDKVSRRAFVVTGVAATGFALAVQPVSAEAIKTGDEGLIVDEIQIPVSDGKIPAYRACPASGGPFPTVLVIQEIFGVHEWVKDICRRLAHLGYFAIAVSLNARQGDVSKAPDMPGVMAIMGKVPDAEVASDLDATVAWAASTGTADTARLGVTGFCWGGRQTWLYAAHNPKVKAAVAWYGPLGYPTNALHPKNPPDLIEQLHVPVLGLYGGADTGIPNSQVQAFAFALKTAHKEAQFIVYPDTPHGFNADYRPSYRPDAARDGWKRMLAWFKARGVG